MKTNRLFRQPIALVCLAVAISTIPFALTAQEKSHPSPPREAAAPTSTASPYTLEIINGELSLAHLRGTVNVSKRWGAGEIASVEATLVNIIDVLRDLHTDANIAMSPDLANVEITDLKLRATSLDEELEALRVASGNRFSWNRPGAPKAGGIDPATGLAVAAVPAGETTLYSLVPDESGTGTTKRSIEVFNLGPFLQHQKDAQASIKEIKEIIQVTLSQLNPDGRMPAEGPSYQFHSGANLLIVIGRQDALEVARKVVLALQAEAGGGSEGGGGFGRYGLPPPPTPPQPSLIIPTRAARLPQRTVHGADGLPTPPPPAQPSPPGANTNR